VVGAGWWVQGGGGRAQGFRVLGVGRLVHAGCGAFGCWVYGFWCMVQGIWRGLVRVLVRHRLIRAQRVASMV